MLLEMDPEQAEELKKGFEELEELVGVKAASPPGGSPGRVEKGLESNGGSLVEAVKNLFLKGLESNRIITRYLSSTTLDGDVEYTVYSIVRDTGVERKTSVMELFSEVFSVDERVFLSAERRGSSLDAPEAVMAGSRLAVSEERYVLGSLRELGELVELPLGSWSEPGRALNDVARGVTHIRSIVPSAKILLLVSPSRFSELLAFHEKAGVMELVRIRQLVGEVVAHPLVSDAEAYMVPLVDSVVDLAFGVRARLDYIGLSEEGRHIFRGWETLALRVKYPKAVVKMSAKS